MMKSNVFSMDVLQILMLEYVTGAVIALALNWCELFVIGRWSALTFCVFGVIKVLVIFLASCIVFGHSFTVESFIGYAVCFVAIVIYNLSKIQNRKEVKLDVITYVKSTALANIIQRCIIFLCKKNKKQKYFQSSQKMYSDFPDPYSNADYVDRNLQTYIHQQSELQLFNSSE